MTATDSHFLKVSYKLLNDIPDNEKGNQFAHHSEGSLASGNCKQIWKISDNEEVILSMTKRGDQIEISGSYIKYEGKRETGANFPKVSFKDRGINKRFSMFISHKRTYIDLFLKKS